MTEINTILGARTRRTDSIRTNSLPRRHSRSVTVLLLAAGAMLAGCVTSPGGRSQLMVISPDTAIVESRVAYLSTVQRLSREDRLLDDPLLADRVQRVTGRVVGEAVARYPHTVDWQWSVALIDEPATVNAWCMAGGRMAVYSGLFARLRPTDDELAQIMSHEIAHAIANHTAERMSIALVTAVGMIAAEAILDVDDRGLTAAALAATLAIRLPNSRAAESEADRLGIELAALAGYEPEAAVTLWDKMAKVGGSAPVPFLSTHPSPANRRETLSGMVPEMRDLMGRGSRQPHPVQMLH
ncbi:MAG: M48 family metallopeptidase [Gammaproteobacteria bacterium]|nr:M48 family metallopeptidase [Gammaproteobacteria bacterium]